MYICICADSRKQQMQCVCSQVWIIAGYFSNSESACLISLSRNTTYGPITQHLLLTIPGISMKILFLVTLLLFMGVEFL
jgi:hypothetical protein